MTPNLPNVTNMSIEQWSAWAAFHVVVATFVVTIVTLAITSIFLFYTAKQYGDVKKAERNLEESKLKQQRFENAVMLLRMIGTDSESPYLKLGALIALADYPEYRDVYNYMVKFYSEELKLPADDKFLMAAKKLVDRT